MPAGSLHKKKLAKRPGYMRPEAQQQIEFQPPADCKPFNPKGLKHGSKPCADFKNCSLHRQGKNDFEFSHCNSSVNSTVVTTSAVMSSTTAGNTPGSCRNLSDHRSRHSENVIMQVCPGAAICKGDFSPVRTSATWQTDLLTTAWQTSHSGRAEDLQKMCTVKEKEVNNYCEHENKEVLSHSPVSQDSFNSSFSFIQLSLNSGYERNTTESQSDGRGAECVLQTNVTGKMDKVNLGELGEGGRSSHKDLGASSCLCRHSEDYKYARETIWNDKLQDCETVSLSDTDATFSCSTDTSDAASAGSSITSGYESSFTISDHNWDTLMRKYEPVLLDCLLGNRSTLKIKALMLRLQRLQEKAVEEDDYDKADKFKKKLEELEREKNSLKFQLPSSHPSISSFLGRFHVQVQAALSRAADRGRSEEMQLWQENEQKLLSPAYHERIQISTAKRDQLLQEKTWLQKETEDLRARLTVLEARDQQLRREIEAQDRLIQLQDCELPACLGFVSLRELQEISKALDDTLGSSCQIPFSLDLPGTVKSLQEKEQSLSMSIKETAAKVCTSQKLCSTLRRKVSDIETQLPALLEAKMLAVSEANVKENAVKYMDMLEDKLHSCGSQLLQRVWEADLEACQLLIRGFQLKEAGCCASEEDKNQADEMEAAADSRLDPEKGKENHIPKGTEWGTAPCPKPCELKEVVADISFGVEDHLSEEFYILSAELGEKCETISEKLVYLEGQLQSAICNIDEGLIQSLQREIQMVKETLQAMLVQLQPAKEAEEDEARDFLCDSWCPGKQDLQE
ncbi:PREDICTED: disrupted in schizophrenia 1 protein isoform X2 [Crocodylus porosus]|uniref:disrupted in schizophrenia 1 protein isoform X2 n=1 Tax=Crocodylus porosus TaxID=8502 RepID=UPI00093EDAC2|nr:PREDICTED: disrupted in schizophrenia 1 protein isoform X2 [Crocodylus porosus]